MTKEEYLQIVHKSVIFKDMGKEVQEMILNAKEEEMQGYLQIFNEANISIVNAEKDLITESAKAIESVEKEIKVLKKDKLKIDENSSDQDDEIKGQALLENLNKM